MWREGTFRGALAGGAFAMAAGSAVLVRAVRTFRPQGVGRAVSELSEAGPYGMNFLDNDALVF